MGEIPPPTPDAPTVLLYSHYDVQPAGDEKLWKSPPFEPTPVEGGLRARGIADDKSNVIAHLGMLRAFKGRPPVGVKIVFEGQEEYGSPFDDYPPTDPERFACDAMVIADLGNLRPGTPTLTTGLRGASEVVVEVRTLEEPRHSGEFGAAPTPCSSCSRPSPPCTTCTETSPSKACAARSGPARATPRTSSAPSPASRTACR
ncbi:M20/M25/M40 family metallo-hydrolase [Streptomyces sp. NBC_00649]|uniref:M20/M25/M40 family metallo-hydrolase n=1 Tax=Streptomyces sp. NBC_00649 TaxID=2975798 RepID=UPI00386D179A